MGMKSKCPDCGCGLIILTSMNLKVCDCGYKVEFRLKPGQKSIFIKGLVGEEKNEKR